MEGLLQYIEHKIEKKKFPQKQYMKVRERRTKESNIDLDGYLFGEEGNENSNQRLIQIGLK